eukprot:ANDGO_05590.mRNA.1 putative WD repeat-containing protein all2124
MRFFATTLYDIIGTKQQQRQQTKQGKEENKPPNKTNTHTEKDREMGPRVSKESTVLHSTPSSPTSDEFYDAEHYYHHSFPSSSSLPPPPPPLSLFGGGSASVSLPPPSAVVPNSPSSSGFVMEDRSHNPFNELQVLRGHRNLVRFMVSTASFLITGGDDGKVIVYNHGTGELVRKIRRRGPQVTAMNVWVSSNSGSHAAEEDALLYVGFADRSMVIWDLALLKLVRIVPQAHSGSIRCFVAVDKDTVCSGASDKFLNLWDRNGDKVGSVLRVDQEPVSCMISTSNGRVAVSARAGFVDVYDVHEKKHVDALPGHDGTVHSLTFVGNNHFMTVANGPEINVWNRFTLQKSFILNLAREIDVQPNRHVPDGVAPSITVSSVLSIPDARYFVAAVDHGFVLVYFKEVDSAFGCSVELIVRDAHLSDIVDMCVVGHRKLITVAEDGLIHIWDLAFDIDAEVRALAARETSSRRNSVNKPPPQPSPDRGVRFPRQFCVGSLSGHSSGIIRVLETSPHTFVTSGRDFGIFLWKDGRVECAQRDLEARNLMSSAVLVQQRQLASHKRSVSPGDRAALSKSSSAFISGDDISMDGEPDIIIPILS